MSKKLSGPVNVTPEDKDIHALKRLERILEGNSSCPKLVGANGEIPLPEPVYQLLLQVVGAMSAGQAFALIPEDHEMSTQEAANLLNVSRPHVVKLLEQGVIPFSMVGTHRRILTRDITEYQKRRDAERRSKLREFTSFLQEEGFYDYDEEALTCEE